MITIHSLCNGTLPRNEEELTELSDNIWELGTLEDIKAQVSSETFYAHIAINTIGIWKGDGWGGVFENPELVPYIVDVMNTLGLSDIAKEFSQTLAAFPPFTVFIDDFAYTDILNFVMNPRFKIKSQLLKEYTSEVRKQRCDIFTAGIEHLDELSDALWSYNAPDLKGWGPVIEYIQKNNPAK